MVYVTPELQHHLLNLDALPVLSKTISLSCKEWIHSSKTRGQQNFCFNKILQLLTGGSG